MEDIVIVTGVLLLRPPEEGDGGITCDGLIQFRPPAGRKKEETKSIPAPEPEEDGTRIDFVPAADEDLTFEDEGSMG